MVLVALALTFSLVTSVFASTGAVVAQSGGLNSFQRHDLPTTLKWQMAPNTDIWCLTAADDGTLFALVEDTSGPQDMKESAGALATHDGLRWAVFPAWSDVSLFKSTDGGFTWTLMWHVPASDTGAPVDVVPQPGYTEGDSANDIVFVAMGTRYLSPSGPGSYVGGPGEGNLYRSLDGGSSFTRVTPRNPSVTLVAAGTITSLDVIENRHVPGTYKAFVGTSSLNTGGGRLEGVWTWNEDDDRDWQDQQVANAMPPAPFPGTMPAGNGLDVIAVMASDNYVEDGCAMAVVSDISGADPSGMAPGVYFCYWDDNDGAWGGDVDSPTNALLTAGVYAWDACMATGDDFGKTSGNNVFVGIDGSGGPPPAGADDVWRINGRSTVTGPSAAQARGLAGLGAARVSDIVVIGSAGSGAVYAGAEFPVGTTAAPALDGQAQVFKGTQMTLWPAWTPSFKPPSGAWPVLLEDMSGSVMAAGGGDGFTTGGVHIMVDGAGGRTVFNGRGLMDDIAVSEDIPGFINLDQPLMGGNTWCLAEATSEDVSPMYETDNHIYVTTYSSWDHNGDVQRPYDEGMSLWRWNGAHWERILKEFVTLPNGGPAATGNYQFRAMPWRTNVGTGKFVYADQWWVRVPRGFSTDPYVFLLGGNGDSVAGGAAQAWFGDMFWYSPDLGDTWINFTQMPIGAVPVGGGLSDSGWWVEDNNTIICGDIAGWLYRTTDRGASWTEGALTAVGLEITTIITSPDYTNDETLIAGTFDPSVDRKNEVWISQDAAMQDLENVGAEVNTDPMWWGMTLGGCMVNFDMDWSNNHVIYAAAGGWMDAWEPVGMGSVDLTQVDSTDVGVYRTEVNLNEPSASTWDQIWGYADWTAIAKDPQPWPAMVLGVLTYRWVAPTGVRIGSDGSLYVPFALWDYTYNAPYKPPEPPSPNPGAPFGRLTAGGILRTLDGTADVVEWDYLEKGLGEWDGLWLNRAVAGGSNTLISLAWDWQEWRWKLAIYDDTLCTSSTPSDPTSGDTGVGTLAGNMVSVTLDWSALDATQYEWQVDDDCGFVAPMVKSGVTSEELVTVTGLEPGVAYCWRVRALEPTLSRWSTPQNFTTIIGSELIAPKLIAPAAGSTLKDSMPMFQWSAIGWATNYDVQVATDSAFTSASMVINSQLGNVQAMQASSELADGTYYWHVRARSATTETPWSSTGTFTIGTPAGEGTAGWVWALIVIGVVLIILMLMLIMRTRRPA